MDSVGAAHPTAPIPAPFVSSVMTVLPEWIDYNGHLNMAYYNVLFDQGADEAFRLLGLDRNYARTQNASFFTAETHLCYLRELHEGAPVRVTYRLVDADEKRIHGFQEIHHAEDGWLSATCEVLTLHVNTLAGRVAPFPAAVSDRIAAMKAAHSGLPLPFQLGRVIGIRSRNG